MKTLKIKKNCLKLFLVVILSSIPLHFLPSFPSLIAFSSFFLLCISLLPLTNTKNKHKKNSYQMGLKIFNRLNGLKKIVRPSFLIMFVLWAGPGQQPRKPFSLVQQHLSPSPSQTFFGSEGHSQTSLCNLLVHSNIACTYATTISPCTTTYGKPTLEVSYTS